MFDAISAALVFVLWILFLAGVVPLIVVSFGVGWVCGRAIIVPILERMSRGN